MQYMTYYEERDMITVGKYQQMKQSMQQNGHPYRMEKYTLRKLKFTGNESQAAGADYSLCMKNGDEKQIFLEKKYIQNGTHFKSCLKLSKEECQRILDGDLEWMKGCRKSMLAEFYLQITLNQLRPGYLTEYERETFSGRKGTHITFCKRINRAVGMTDRLFEKPEMVIRCLDEGKVLVMYKKAVKLPKIFSGLFTGQEEQPEEAVLTL